MPIVPETGSHVRQGRLRGGFGTAAAAALLTAGIFLLIPYLELLAKSAAGRMKLRTVEPVHVASPPPRPVERAYRLRADARSVPRPRLHEPLPKLIPVRANLNLELVLGDVRGDYDLDFDIVSPDRFADLGALVFEIEQVDEPPQPIAQLRPMYPPAARMRRLEGEVEVVFVVRADGTTSDLEVLSSQPGDFFVNATLQAIRHWRFRPGTFDGEPVAVRVQQKIVFRMEEAW